MDAIIQHAPPLQGRLSVPADKAIGHRAALIAALASGSTTIAPWPAADDCQQTLRLVQQLGVKTRAHGDQLIVEGRGARGLQPPAGALHCGESGTTLRLAAGMLAGQPFTSVLTAGPALSRRPMRRIIEPLSLMGARVDGTVCHAGSQELCPPLTIRGRRPLKAIAYQTPIASAQVKSAILLAGLAASAPTSVMQPVVTRDHTERLLRHYGIEVLSSAGTARISPRQPVSPGHVDLPGDISSAAFFLVAATCVPGSMVTLQAVGCNPTRIGVVRVLQRMGASLTLKEEAEAWEPRADITAQAAPLRGIVLQPSEVAGVIDELPILMVAAACAVGKSVFVGLEELRVKETDRVQSMLEGLRQFGADIRLPRANVVEIHGGPLHGGVVDGAADHRTVMSLAVAGLVAQGTTMIQGAECVAKSYPTFFDDLRVLAGSSTVKTVDKA